MAVRLWVLVVISITIAAVPVVSAHGTGELSQGETLRTWTWTPASLLATSLLVGVYGVGVYRLWKQAGIGHGVRIGQTTAYGCAVLVSILALFSPLDALSDALFSAHMTQHMLLIFIAAPLFAASGLPIVLLWVLPRTWSHSLGRLWTRANPRLHLPLFALIFFTLMLWLWHVPSFYEAALHQTTIHEIEHGLFIGSSVLYWWAYGQMNRRSPGAAILYLFAGLLESGALGALLTFSSRSWYGWYSKTTAPWGLTPLDDQQLGGVLMWVPGHLFFMALIIAAFYRWLSHLESATQNVRGQP